MSRELDALIAEKVMGWRVTICDPYHEWLGNDRGQVRPLPRYSTDIAAAWQVVERMRTHVPDYRALRMESVPLGYTVAFYSHTNPLNRIGAFVAAETAPLAICLAALQALGIEAPVEETRGK